MFFPKSSFFLHFCLVIFHLSVNVVRVFKIKDEKEGEITSGSRKPQRICILSIRNWWQCCCLFLAVRSFVQAQSVSAPFGLGSVCL